MHKSAAAGELLTEIELDGVEVEDKVYYYDQPAEPDVGVAGGIEIEDVMVDGKSVMSQLSKNELDGIAMMSNDRAQAKFEAQWERY